jgi:hypothetical protein
MPTRFRTPPDAVAVLVPSMWWVRDQVVDEVRGGVAARTPWVAESHKHDPLYRFRGLLRTAWRTSRAAAGQLKRCFDAGDPRGKLILPGSVPKLRSIYPQDSATTVAGPLRR